MLNRTVHGDGNTWSRSGPRWPVLFGTRPSITAQFHVQVQGDSCRGSATIVITRVPQRVASWRSAPAVSSTVWFIHRRLRITVLAIGGGWGHMPLPRLEAYLITQNRVKCTKTLYFQTKKIWTFSAAGHSPFFP